MSNSREKGREGVRERDHVRLRACMHTCTYTAEGGRTGRRTSGQRWAAAADFASRLGQASCVIASASNLMLTHALWVCMCVGVCVRVCVCVHVCVCSCVRACVLTWALQDKVSAASAAEAKLSDSHAALSIHYQRFVRGGGAGYQHVDLFGVFEVLASCAFDARAMPV